MNKEKKSKLDGKIDEIIEMLIDGKSYREIANYYKVPLSTLHDFTSKPEHSARAREALLYSASAFDEMAIEALKNAPSTMTEIQRARELAQHYRWKAAKRAPKTYGEKLELDAKVESTTKTIFKLPGGAIIEM